MSTAGSAAANKELVKNFMNALHTVRDTRDTSIIEQYLAPDVVMNITGFPPDAKGIEAFKQAMFMFINAFPDLQITELYPLIAQGDTVAVRVSWTGTNTGDFMGIPATGKRVSLTDCHIERIANGKIVERFAVTDAMNMMQQLGIIPAPQQSSQRP
jgi:steroid delta-isomerase-like uncharacterized protein